MSRNTPWYFTCSIEYKAGPRTGPKRQPPGPMLRKQKLSIFKGLSVINMISYKKPK